MSKNSNEPVKAEMADLPALADLKRQPGHLFRRLHQITTALFADEVCNPSDLTSVQFIALVAASEVQVIDATRIAELIAFDRATIGSVIVRLVKKGYVLRSLSSRDKRVKEVTLTRAGALKIAEVNERLQQVQDRLFIDLTEDERAILVALAAKLVRAHDKGHQNGE